MKTARKGPGIFNSVGRTFVRGNVRQGGCSQWSLCKNAASVAEEKPCCFWDVNLIIIHLSHVLEVLVMEV